MAKRKFTGVFIPAKIWLNKDLTVTEKFLLAEIDALSEDDEPCYANNRHFGDALGCKPASISNHLMRLQTAGFLTITYKDERTKAGRLLSVNSKRYHPTQSVDDPTQKMKGATQEMKPPTQNVEQKDNLNTNEKKKKVKDANAVSFENEDLKDEKGKPIPTSAGLLPKLDPNAPPQQKETYPQDFLTFWKQYAYTKGSKKKAADLWAKMSETERTAAMSALPKYVLETNTADVPGQSWKPMRCHAFVYLNQKRWEGYEDEIKEKNGDGVETPFDEAYQKYLSVAKLKWPEVLDYTAHLSKKEFVSYKEETYFDQLHRIGEPMRWREFMKSHDLWNRAEPEARKFTTVWPYHLKRLHDKIEAHNVL